MSDAYEHDKWATIATAGFYVVLCGYVAIAMTCALAAPVGKFDDAIPLVHGMLIQRGSVPNVDFYSAYPPLGLYLNAAVFSLFGRTVIANRTLSNAFFLIVVMLVIWLYRARFRSWGPLVPVATLAVASSIGSAISIPSWPGFALSLSALLMYLRSQEAERHRLWIVAGSGVLAALALLHRINFGGYVLVVIAIDFLQRWWLDGRDRGSFRLQRELTALTAFVLPLITVTVGFCVWVYGGEIAVGVSQFIVRAQRLMALRGFIQLEFAPPLASGLAVPFFWFYFRLLNGADRLSLKALFPAVIYVALFTAAFAGRRHLSVALTVVALELAAVVLLHIFIRRLERIELSIVMFFCCVLHYYVSRADWLHWRLVPIVGTLLIPFLFVRNYDETRQDRYASSSTRGTALTLMTVVIFGFLSASEFRPQLADLRNGLSLVAGIRHDSSATDSERMLSAVVPLPAWESIYPDRDELALLRYMRAKSSQSTPLFVGVKDHSRTFWNNLRMYWLADRSIGVREFLFEDRVTTEAPVQEGIITDLERNRATWIVLDCVQEGDAEFRRANYQGSTLLDEYIASRFREEARFGRYAIATRLSDQKGTATLPCAEPSRGLDVRQPH